MDDFTGARHELTDRTPLANSLLRAGGGKMPHS